MSNRTGLPLRTTLCAAAGALALTLGACGGGGGGDEQISITSSGDPSAAMQVEAPDPVEAGTAEITLDNQGDQASDAQLIRVEGDRSADEVAAGLGKAIAGKPFPDWFFPAGGVGQAAPGKSLTVTQVLEPGTYWVEGPDAPTDGPPQTKVDPASLTSFEVTGEASDAELPSEQAKVEAFEYNFETEGLKQGSNTVLFENIGAQPHHLVIAPLVEGKTLADVKAAITGQGGPPPIDEAKIQTTAVLDGGTSQVIDLDLQQAGPYAMLCFATDRQGGPPHIVKGMAAEVDVK